MAKIVVLFIFCALLSWMLIILFHDHKWIFVFTWPGTIFTIVLLSYWFNRPGIFGKNPNTGHIHWFFILLFLPFFLLVWTVWLIKAKLTKEVPYTPITDKVFLGRYSRKAEGLPIVSKNCLTVDITSEFPESRLLVEHTEYRCILSLDAYYPRDMETYLDVLEEAVRWHGLLYIHCAHGHGRSATFVCLVLLLKGEVSTIDEGIIYLKNLRPKVSVNHKQKEFALEIVRYWNLRKAREDSLF